LELSAGFPGLTSSRRGLAAKAKREGWKSRKRQGRGGGLEYHISSLPLATQEHLSRKPREGQASLQFKAILWINRSWHSFVLMERFCKDYNLGLLHTPTWVNEAFPSLCATQLFNICAANLFKGS
jgi:hypothetical protein